MFEDQKAQWAEASEQGQGGERAPVEANLYFQGTKNVSWSADSSQSEVTDAKIAENTWGARRHFVGC